MTFYLVHFGCKTNRYDAVALTLPLIERGYREVDSPRVAELIVINTCTVTSRSDAKARASIRHLHRENPRASIVVSGCSVETQGEVISSLPGVDLAIGVNDHSAFLRFLDRRHGVERSKGRDLDPWREGITGFPGRSRVFLKIQDGCANRCSYCVIPRVRGASRSRSPEDVVREAGRLLAAEHTELVLTGIHIGHYGKDLVPRRNLVDLVRRLLAETEAPLIRLGSLNPDEISEELLELMASDGRIARHLHIPLQSGSDRVLAAMARSYRSRDFARVVTRACSVMPVMNVGSDVIVGFPSESRDDFEETCSLIRRLPVGYLHVFTYSDRKGTAATSLRKCAPSEEITARGKRMKLLGREKRAAFLATMIGADLRSVYERQADDGRFIYRSTNYLKLYSAERHTGTGAVVLTAGAFTGDGLSCTRARPAGAAVR